MASRFGVGGSTYHWGEEVTDAEHVPFGAYPVDLLRSMGGWDEELVVNQDFELDYRLRAAGHRILFDPAMRIDWECRQSVGALFKQYKRYGGGKVVVALKHPASLRPRHFAAPALVALLGAAAVVSVRKPALGAVTRRAVRRSASASPPSRRPRRSTPRHARTSLRPSWPCTWDGASASGSACSASRRETLSSEAERSSPCSRLRLSDAGEFLSGFGIHPTGVLVRERRTGRQDQADQHAEPDGEPVLLEDGLDHPSRQQADERGRRAQGERRDVRLRMTAPDEEPRVEHAADGAEEQHEADDPVAEQQVQEDVVRDVLGDVLLGALFVVHEVRVRVRTR